MPVTPAYTRNKYFQVAAVELIGNFKCQDEQYALEHATQRSSSSGSHALLAGPSIGIYGQWQGSNKSDKVQKRYILPLKTVNDSPSPLIERENLLE